MRLFELTIGVYLGDEGALPESMNEWMELAGFDIPGASPTFLRRVVEVRHPPAEDIVDRRKGRNFGGIY